MIHGLYGSFKFNAVYMKKNYENGSLTCSKRFPKDFNGKIIVSKDGYPEYRRRRVVDGAEVTWGDGGIYDN
jgi:hypothetical protein